MARQRRTVSLLAPIITGCAVLLAVTVLGVFCWSLLFGLRREESSHEVLSELLVGELNLLHPTPLSGPEHGPDRPDLFLLGLGRPRATPPIAAWYFSKCLQSKHLRQQRAGRLDWCKHMPMTPDTPTGWFSVSKKLN